MVSFVGKLSVVVVLLEGKMAAAFKFTMIAAVVVALGRRQDAAIIGPGPAHPHEHLTPGHLGVNLGVIRQRGELLT